MKKIILTVVTVLILAWCQLVFAVGTCTQTLTGVYDSQTKLIGKYELTLSFTADGDTGAFPATAISAENLKKLGTFFLYRAETKPGSPAPQDQYDITIVNSNSYDVVGGLLANRSNTATQDVLLAPSIGYYQVGSSTLTITPTNSNVAGGKFTITLEFTR